MKRVKYLFLAVMALAFCGCEPYEEGVKKEYPVLTSLADTLWYSYDSANKIFYDITYGEDSKGVMLGYSEQDRVNEVVNRPFTYTFTPATSEIDAIVRVNFEDGQLYGGFLAPKGVYQINLQDVYLIQLYEVYENGEVIYNVDGSFKSTLLMWME